MKKLFKLKNIVGLSMLLVFVGVALAMSENSYLFGTDVDLGSVSIYSGGTTMAALMPIWIVKEADKETFKALSSEELKGLSDEQVLEYSIAKEKHNASQLEEAFTKFDKLKEEGGELKDAIKAVKDAQEEQNKSQKQILESIGNLTKAMSEEVKKNKSKGVLITQIDHVKKSLTDNMEALKSMRDGRTLGFVNIKAPGVMTRPGNITGSESDRYPEPEYIQGLKLIAERNPFISEFLSTGGTSNATIIYIEEANPEGDFEMTAEGTIKPILDFEMVPATSNAKKTAGFIKVSDEMLDDIDFLAAEINRRLRKKHDLKLEDNVLNGDGLGENFNGITNQAPAFAAGGLTALIATPNNSDVIRAAVNQVLVSSDGAYYPSACFVHPDDLALMDLQKDTTGAYVLPPFQSVDGRVIAGVRVIGKTKIPTGFFLCGDFMEAQLRSYVAFNIQIGWENDDFTKNLVTILGESRNHFYIPVNSLSAFVYDEFSVAKTALTTI